MERQTNISDSGTFFDYLCTYTCIHSFQLSTAFVQITHHISHVQIRVTTPFAWAPSIQALARSCFTKPIFAPNLKRQCIRVNRVIWTIEQNALSWRCPDDILQAVHYSLPAQTFLNRRNEFVGYYHRCFIYKLKTCVSFFQPIVITGESSNGYPRIYRDHRFVSRSTLRWFVPIRCESFIDLPEDNPGYIQL